MNKEGLNTGFALKKEQEIGCANSIPALGTIDTASVNARSGFSILGAKAAPKNRQSSLQNFAEWYS